MITLDLASHRALVTGSTRGIGLAIATRLAESGAVVGVNGRSDAAVDQAIEQIASTVPAARLEPVAADVAVAEGAERALELFPAPDVLVNNLGIYGAEDAFEITDERWREYFDVNVLSGVRLTRSVMPGMMAGGWGRVLFIASDAAVVPTADMVHYAVSKTALLGVSRGFAKVAAGSGVTVNSVIAGPTETEGLRRFAYQLVDPSLSWPEAEAEFMRLHRPQSLIRRLIAPREIADLVVYLSSELASATTGGAVRVDGGYVDAILP